MRKRKQAGGRRGSCKNPKGQGIALALELQGGKEKRD